MSGLLLLLVGLCAACKADPGAAGWLPSWSDGPVRQELLGFVARVVDPTGEDFVPPAERIAVFDNDGTLWSEQPLYVQLQYAIDYVRAHAGDRPDWRDHPGVSALLRNDPGALAAAGVPAIMDVILVSHAGMTQRAFENSVGEWLRRAVHPQRDRRYTELVYQPMLELMALLRANGFQTWIVTGGGADFVRSFAPDVYQVPPERVIGSRVALEYQVRDGRPVLVRGAEIDFINDKAGKPVGIERHIGRRPLAAFGNSDGDLQMLQWTAAGDGPRLMFLLHHTDAEREWAYDADSHVGGLDAALREARARDWLVADMRRDWRVVYPHELETAAAD